MCLQTGEEVSKHIIIEGMGSHSITNIACLNNMKLITCTSNERVIQALIQTVLACQQGTCRKWMLPALIHMTEQHMSHT